MDKNKKVYVDSRYKTNDSVSNSDFKFADNAVCFIDDMYSPHMVYNRKL